MREISCTKVGFAPDCDEIIQGETEDELAAAVVAHGRDAHGFVDVELTAELRDSLLTDSEET